MLPSYQSLNFFLSNESNPYLHCTEIPLILLAKLPLYLRALCQTLFVSLLQPLSPQHLLQRPILSHTQVISLSSFMKPPRSSILLGSKTSFDTWVYSSCPDERLRLSSHLCCRDFFPHGSGNWEVKIKCWSAHFLVRTSFQVADGHLPLCPDMPSTSSLWWREDTLSLTSVEADTALRSFLSLNRIPNSLPLESSCSSQTRGQGPVCCVSGGGGAAQFVAHAFSRVVRAGLSAHLPTPLRGLSWLLYLKWNFFLSFSVNFTLFFVSKVGFERLSSGADCSV